jgi:O-antigen ligase
MELLKNKIFWISLVLGLLPISIQLCTYALILLALFTIATLILEKRALSFYKKKSFWILTSLAWVTYLGLAYTQNFKAGLQAVEVQGAIVLFPFIFSEIEISQFDFVKIKFSFVTILLLICFVLEIRIILRMILDGYPIVENFFSWNYTYENLTASYVVQPVYLGIYLVLSSIFCVSFIEDQNHKFFSPIAWIFILIFNFFFLLQLGVRSAIILCTFLVVPYIIFILFRKRKLFLPGLIILLLFVTGAVSLFVQSGFTRMRMEGALKELTSKDLRSYDPKSRIIIWSCAMEIIKDHWIAGVGTGDDEQFLKESYKRKGLKELYDDGLNAHNEYLTLIMRHGLLGLVIIICYILMPIYFYLRHKRIEALLFTLLIAGFFVTESVLNRFQGVVFFSFFTTIYLTSLLDRQQNADFGLRN